MGGFVVLTLLVASLVHCSDVDSGEAKEALGEGVDKASAANGVGNGRVEASAGAAPARDRAPGSPIKEVKASVPKSQGNRESARPGPASNDAVTSNSVKNEEGATTGGSADGQVKKLAGTKAGQKGHSRLGVRDTEQTAEITPSAQQKRSDNSAIQPETHGQSDSGASLKKSEKRGQPDKEGTLRPEEHAQPKSGVNTKRKGSGTDSKVSASREGAPQQTKSESRTGHSKTGVPDKQRGQQGKPVPAEPSSVAEKDQRGPLLPSDDIAYVSGFRAAQVKRELSRLSRVT